MPAELHNEQVLKAKSEFRRRIRGQVVPKALDAGLWLGYFMELAGDYANLVGYMPMADEPDCRGILEYWLHKGRIVYLPVFNKEKGVYGLAQVGGLDGEWLCVGNYGIAEPLPSLPRREAPFQFEGGCVWLVPGLGFAKNGVRLGRGAGYYDRLLAGSNALKIGLAYKERVFDWLPAEEHDVRMDYLLTETGLAKVN